jgi:hypothetical protein
MFSHRLSLIGYSLVGLAVLALVLTFRHIGAFGFAFLLPYVISGGGMLIFLGVIARGFERVEAAILSRRI